MTELVENLQVLAGEALELVTSANELSALEKLRVDYLGKKGKITALLKGLGKLSNEERPRVGAQINAVKQQGFQVFPGIKSFNLKALRLLAHKLCIDRR